MFVACRGLPTLVGLIDGQDYTANRELILTAIQCIVAVRTRVYAVCRLPWRASACFTRGRQDKRGRPTHARPHGRGIACTGQRLRWLLPRGSAAHAAAGQPAPRPRLGQAMQQLAQTRALACRLLAGARESHQPPVHSCARRSSSSRAARRRRTTFAASLRSPVPPLACRTRRSQAQSCGAIRAAGCEMRMRAA